MLVKHLTVNIYRSAGEALRSLDVMAQDTTVRRFLAASAIRAGANYAMTADDIIGVDWNLAYNSTPAMTPHITAPTLVLAMSCHYLLVPGEIIFDRLAAKDKTLAAVEGATHGFAPCKPEYGDTTSVLKIPLAPVAYVMATMIVIAALIHIALIFVPHGEDAGASII